MIFVGSDQRTQDLLMSATYNLLSRTDPAHAALGQRLELLTAAH